MFAIYFANYVLARLKIIKVAEYVSLSGIHDIYCLVRDASSVASKGHGWGVLRSIFFTKVATFVSGFTISTISLIALLLSGSSQSLANLSKNITNITIFLQTILDRVNPPPLPPSPAGGDGCTAGARVHQEQ